MSVLWEYWRCSAFVCLTEHTLFFQMFTHSDVRLNKNTWKLAENGESFRGRPDADGLSTYSSEQPLTFGAGSVSSHHASPLVTVETSPMTSAASTFSSARTCALRCRPSPSLLCSPWRRPRTASPQSPRYVWLSSGNQPGFRCCGTLWRRTHLHLPWTATRKKTMSNDKYMHCFVLSDVLHFNKSKTSK